jgi:hypothetical protein
VRVASAGGAATSGGAGIEGVAGAELARVDGVPEEHALQAAKMVPRSTTVHVRVSMSHYRSLHSPRLAMYQLCKLVASVQTFGFRPPSVKSFGKTEVPLLT